MENIKELIGLSQQVSAVMDDIGEFDVVSVSVDYKGSVCIAVSPELFFKTFKGFKIESLDNPRFKFRLTKVVQGVRFSALANDLSGLKVIKLVEQNRLRKGHKKSLHAGQCG